MCHSARRRGEASRHLRFTQRELTSPRQWPCRHSNSTPWAARAPRPDQGPQATCRRGARPPGKALSKAHTLAFPISRLLQRRCTASLPRRWSSSWATTACTLASPTSLRPPFDSASWKVRPDFARRLKLPPRPRLCESAAPTFTTLNITVLLWHAPPAQAPWPHAGHLWQRTAHLRASSPPRYALPSPCLAPRQLRTRTQKPQLHCTSHARFLSHAPQCPVCFHEYAGPINSTSCCSQPLCSECFLFVQTPACDKP